MTQRVVFIGAVGVPGADGAPGKPGKCVCNKCPTYFDLQEPEKQPASWIPADPAVRFQTIQEFPGYKEGKIVLVGPTGRPGKKGATGVCRRVKEEKNEKDEKDGKREEKKKEPNLLEKQWLAHLQNFAAEEWVIAEGDKAMRGPAGGLGEVGEDGLNGVCWKEIKQADMNFFRKGKISTKHKELVDKWEQELIAAKTDLHILETQLQELKGLAPRPPTDAQSPEEPHWLMTSSLPLPEEMRKLRSYTNCIFCLFPTTEHPRSRPSLWASRCARCFMFTPSTHWSQPLGWAQPEQGIRDEEEKNKKEKETETEKEKKENVWNKTNLKVCPFCVSSECYVQCKGDRIFPEFQVVMEKNDKVKIIFQCGSSCPKKETSLQEWKYLWKCEQERKCNQEKDEDTLLSTLASTEPLLSTRKKKKKKVQIKKQSGEMQEERRKVYDRVLDFLFRMEDQKSKEHKSQEQNSPVWQCVSVEGIGGVGATGPVGPPGLFGLSGNKDKDDKKEEKEEKESFTKKCLIQVYNEMHNLKISKLPPLFLEKQTQKGWKKKKRILYWATEQDLWFITGLERFVTTFRVLFSRKEIGAYLRTMVVFQSKLCFAKWVDKEFKGQTSPVKYRIGDVFCDVYRKHDHSAVGPCSPEFGIPVSLIKDAPSWKKFLFPNRTNKNTKKEPVPVVLLACCLMCLPKQKLSPEKKTSLAEAACAVSCWRWNPNFAKIGCQFLSVRQGWVCDA